MIYLGHLLQVILYPASPEDLGLLTTNTLPEPGDLKGRSILEETSTPRPSRPTLEDMKKPARKGKHVVTLLLVFLIFSLLSWLLSPSRSFLTARWISGSDSLLSATVHPRARLAGADE